MTGQPPKLYFFHVRTWSILVRGIAIMVCYRVAIIFNIIRDTKRRSRLPWRHIRPSICRRPDSYTCFFIFCCLFGDVAFPKYFVFPLPLFVCMESKSYVLSFRMVFLYLVTMG